MHVLIFHGYLLEGTGSNVYNARLAAALVRLGHDVHLLSQDRHPERQPFVDAIGSWDSGSLQVSLCDRPARRQAHGQPAGSCTVYRPDIGGLLPVYVADRYEGIEARTFAQCSNEEVASYIDANVAAVGELLGLVRPELALANHLVMGPVILARGLRGEVPYAVKVHGSALEYTVKPEPERFLGLAREGLAGAVGVLVGSHHTAASLWQALEDPEIVRRTRLGPPGVDVERFAPREPGPAAAGVRALAMSLGASVKEDREGNGAGQARQQPADGPSPQASEPVPVENADAFARDGGAAAAALTGLDPGRDVLVAYVGKLIVSKGVDLLIAAWPLVLEQVPRARLVVVGFGAYRAGLERLCAALLAGDLAQAREIAIAGRELEAQAPSPSSPSPSSQPAQSQPTQSQPTQSQPLRHLLAFLDSLRGEQCQRFLAAARTLDEQVVFVGRLDHGELAELLPACRAAVLPSTFPEAFGMVAAEAAACGALPISAAHSGLAEVSGVLARAVPDEAAEWLSFTVDDHAVPALAACLSAWLQAAPELQQRTRNGLVETVRERWSWEGVATGVLAAARGELGALAKP